MDQPISIAGNMAVVMPNIPLVTQNWKSEIKILTGSPDPTIDGMYRVISEKVLVTCCYTLSKICLLAGDFAFSGQLFLRPNVM